MSSKKSEVPKQDHKLGGKAPLEEQMIFFRPADLSGLFQIHKKRFKIKTQTATRWVWMTNDPTLAFTCSFGRFSPPSMW